MIKSLLFKLPRPTIPIFIRRSVVAAADVGNDIEISSSFAAKERWVESDMEFPIRRIYCVGRNYREHSLEMGHDPDRENPFFFQKPTDGAIVVCSPATAESNTTTTCLPYPPITSSLHYEAELIVAIGKGQEDELDGLNIPVEKALDYVYGYSIGCDLTRRDLQSEAKKMGRPWDTAKGFDSSCPLSPIIPKDDIDLDANTTIQLTVNGSIRQTSNLGKMIYSTAEIICHLSQLFRLQAGDLILTGTPSGVSHVNKGDVVSISCGDLIPCEFIIGDTEG